MTLLRLLVLTLLLAPALHAAEPPTPSAQPAKDALKAATPGPVTRLGWGKTYLAKDGTLLLQLNVWSNGEDYVLPIANDPLDVRWLTDKPTDAPKFVRKDDGLHLTNLPKTPPAKLPLVLALNFGERPPKPLDNAVRQTPDGSLTLLATTCEVHSTNAKLEKKGDRPYNIGYWTNVKDHLTWDATIDKGGTFDVTLEYSLGGSPGPAEIDIEFGPTGPKLPVKLQPGKDFLDFRTIPIGQVKLAPGPITITLRPTKKPGVAVMDLRRIDLKPK